MPNKKRNKKQKPSENKVSTALSSKDKEIIDKISNTKTFTKDDDKSDSDAVDDSDSDTSSTSSENDDFEDEEISEDDAFNSEDEKKYGSFFNKKSNDDESSDEDDDDASEDFNSDEEGDNGDYMLSLLDKIAPSNTKEKQDTTSSAIYIPENEFSSSILSSNTNALSLNDLMKGISNTTSYSSIQKSMKVFHTSEAKAPLPKIQTERKERQLHYTNSSKDVSLWNTVVHANRDAETLDFRPVKSARITTEDLNDFTPETEFEKEISQALERKAAKESDDEDDLGEAIITMEDLKKRRGELAKLRALMFYEEQKRHYINKIKSKKYRKIRRKQKERLESQYGEDNSDKEEREKEEVERIKERMSLAHKNTSKWAKRQLRRGKNLDKETRQALSAQIQKGDDLLNRMKHSINQEEDDDVLLSQAKSILQLNEKEDEPSHKLFQMDFMKKGLEKQREKAKEETRALLQDILTQHEVQQDVSDNEKEQKKKHEAPKTKKDNAVSDGKLAKSIQHGNVSTTVSINGNITIDDFVPLPQKQNNTKEFTTSFSLSNDEKKKSNSNKSKKKVSIVDSSNNQKEDNPWMSSSTNDDKDTSITTHDVLQDALTRNTQTTPKDKTKDKMTNLTQEELIQKAFAQPKEPDFDPEMEEEFLNEKKELEEKRNKRKKEDTIRKGWGSWAGEGISTNKKQRHDKKEKLHKEKISQKQDKLSKNKHVMINHNAINKKCKHQIVNTIPYPFTSLEEYEHSMLGTIGKEWNVHSGVESLTQEEIKSRAGRIITPISKQWKLKKGQMHRQQRRNL